MCAWHMIVSSVGMRFNLQTYRSRAVTSEVAIFGRKDEFSFSMKILLENIF